MKKVFTTIALAVFCMGGLIAQTATSSTMSKEQGDKHCLAQADEQTWSSLGLNDDQIRKVKEIQTRYKLDTPMDRGTENTMRGTTDDAATPTTGTTGTTGTDRTTGTTGTTGTDRTTGSTGTTGTDRTTGTTSTDPSGTATGTTGRTGTDVHGTSTSTGRTTDQLGYDDTKKEAMERELRTVLTTAQFESYQEWCQDQDSSRGDSNTDMDR